MDRLEQWSGVLREYCCTIGWARDAEPQSYIGKVLNSVAVAIWKCKRHVVQAKALYKMV